MAAARDQNGRKRASKWDTPAPSTGSATDAAREAARKLNAMLAAKGKLTTNAPPPLLPPKPKSTTGTASAGASTSMFTEEVEINDSPKRLLLCQGNVQYEINRYSGAAISTKGQYIAPSEKGNMIGQKPLYLCVQSMSRDKVNLALERICGIMNGDDPFKSPPVPPQHMSQSGQTSNLPSGMYYVQEKVFVGLDNVQPEFNLKEKILGPGESYFHHITKETGAKVHLRGRGSGYIEATSGREAFEALYVYISHTNYPGLNAAKKLVENLIQTVHTAYQQFQMQQTSNSYYQNYGGYPGQNTAVPQQRPPNMYNMPPASGYGAPHHPNGPPPPSYPSYPYPPPNQPPPQYHQPGPNHNIPPNPPMPPPHAMYPHPVSHHEGPRPLMDQHPTRPPMQQLSTPYTPESPTKPRPGPPSSYDTPSVPDQGSSKRQEKSSKDDEKPTEEPKPAKRRFTEAPAKKTIPPTVSESVTIEKRSVLSLDQPSTQSHTLEGDDSGKITSGNMAPPLLPAPKVKSSDRNAKKDNVSSSDGFKMPIMPMSAVLSGVKKNMPAPPEAKMAEKKRKLDDSAKKEPDNERKSTGIALLGSYDDDSSDED